MLFANLTLLLLAVLVAGVAACCASGCCGGPGLGAGGPRAGAAACVAVLLVLLGIFAACAPRTRVGDGDAATLTLEGFDAPRGRGLESPVGHKMSTYDGVHLRTKCPDKWRHPPCGLPYHHPSRLSESLVQGHGAPDVTPPASEPDHGPETPTVDGRPDSPRSKFMFAYNQCRPECCPSTYSCSNGCVCTTPEQRRFLQQRGTNHSQETD